MIQRCFTQDGVVAPAVEGDGEPGVSDRHGPGGLDEAAWGWKNNPQTRSGRSQILGESGRPTLSGLIIFPAAELGAERKPALIRSTHSRHSTRVCGRYLGRSRDGASSPTARPASARAA